MTVLLIFAKAAELVTVNLVKDESHLLDIRLYLEQRLLVSPISLCQFLFFNGLFAVTDKDE